MMTPQEKIDFAKDWYSKGECPGCGHPLRMLSKYGRHRVSTGLSLAGGDEGHAIVRSEDVCLYDSDALASMTLMATGVVSAPA